MTSSVPLTKVVVVADLSGSMAYGTPRLEATQRQMIADFVRRFAQEEADGRQRFDVTILGFSDRVLQFSSKPALAYTASAFELLHTRFNGMGGGTALRDAIGHALGLVEPDIRANTTCLVSVFTDGEENRSYAWSAPRIKETVERLERTGYLTLTVAGPASASRHLASMGVQPGNFRAWDGGVEQVNMAQETVRAVDSYVVSRRAGSTQTKKFYADASALTPAGIKANTKLVAPSDIKKVTRHMAGRSIADFYGSKFAPGTHYYELVKAEYIQDDKELVILIKDQNEYRLGSRAVRTILGLPEVGKIRVHPAQATSNYQIFVQSSSNNRKVVEGQTMLTVTP